MSGRFLPRRVPAVLLGLGARRPRLVLGLGVAVVIAAIALAFHVRIDTDVLSLVPQDDPAIDAFRTTIERFGSVDMLIGVVEVPDGGSLEAAFGAADLLAERLRESKLIRWVEYRLEEPETTLLPVLDHGTLFLSPDRLDAFLDGLEGDGARRTARHLHAMLSSPQGIALKRLYVLDPGGLVPSLLGRLRTGDVGATFDPESGYMIGPGRTMVLVMARPVRPAQDIVFDSELAAELVHIRDDVGRRWRDDGWEGDPPAIRFTGGYVIAWDDQKIILGDLKVGVLSSLAGVLLLFLLAFRRPGALLHAFVPLVVGLASTFVFGAVALGHLNSITTAFAALLIGLGVDFVIVLYGRYAEERAAGSGHRTAVDVIGRMTGGGVLLGATTTAATFLAFTVTRFRGLSELGLLTGVGILLLVGTVFLLLPALLEFGRGDPERWRGMHLRSFGLDDLAVAAVRRPGRTVMVALVATVIVAAGLPRLRFNDDIRSMRAAGNPGVVLRQRVMDAFGLRFTPMMVRIDGADVDAVVEAAHGALPVLRKLVDGENLAKVDSIADLLPPPSVQREVIRELRRRVPDPDALVVRFEAALREEGLNPAAFAAGLEHLRRALSVDRPFRVEDLQGTPLEHVAERYLATGDGWASTVVYCYPPAGRWRREAPPALEQAVAGLEDAVLTGPNVVSKRLREIVWSDAFHAAGVGLVIVFLLMAADLGGLRRAALALLPLAFGLLWMLGWMGWLGFEVNLMNIFVVTMVIGIGVDYGIHLVHRWDESGGDPEVVTGTSRAVVVAALTTMVGFGSLVLSHFPGLRSIGAAAIFGSLFSAVGAIVLLPALLHRRRR